MVQTQRANWQQWFSFILVGLLTLGFAFNVADMRTGTSVDVPTAEEIAALVSVPARNDTAVLDAVADVRVTLNENDEFENTVFNIATADWSRRDYKEIYNALDDLFGDIEEREDITNVVIRDEEVTSSDIDDEDAVVVQELKVYYENTDGDDRKVYLTVETEIEEVEVEDVEITETN